MKLIAVRDANGQTWRTAPQAIGATETAALAAHFEDAFDAEGTLAIDMPGGATFFNLRHVASVTIEEVGG